MDGKQIAKGCQRIIHRICPSAILLPFVINVVYYPFAIPSFNPFVSSVLGFHISCRITAVLLANLHFVSDAANNEFCLRQDSYDPLYESCKITAVLRNQPTAVIDTADKTHMILYMTAAIQLF